MAPLKQAPLIGLLVGATAWAISTQLSYSLVARNCDLAADLVPIIAAICLAVPVVGGALLLPASSILEGPTVQVGGGGVLVLDDFSPRLSPALTHFRVSDFAARSCQFDCQRLPKMRWLVIVFGFLAFTSPVSAHGVGEAWSSEATWTADPLILVPLYIFRVIFLTGTIAYGVMRALAGARGFAGRLFLDRLDGACASPSISAPLAFRALASAHMVEHELMAVAAPLLMLSRPPGVFVWAIPQTWRVAFAQTLAPSSLALALNQLRLRRYTVPPSGAGIFRHSSMQPWRIGG